MSGILSTDIEAFVELFQKSQWKEFELCVGEDELYLSKDVNGRPSRGGVSKSEVHLGQVAPQPSANAPIAVDAQPAAEKVGKSVDAIEGCVVISAPSLGTFYRAPKPGTPAFVELGQQVDQATELCLIEVMKLFTTLSSGVNGKVREIFVNDGDLVENGQPLFLIEIDE